MDAVGTHVMIVVRRALSFAHLSWSDRLYKIAALIFAAFLPLGVAGGLGMARDNPAVPLFSYAFVAACTMALVTESISVVWRIKSYRWAQVLGSGLGFVAFWLAVGRAHLFINAETGLDPSNFKNSSILLTTLFIPYAWTELVIGLVAICSFAALIGFPILIAKTKDEVKGLKVFARLFGLLGTLIFTNGIVNQYDQRGTLLQDALKYLVVVSDYFPHHSCINLPTDVRVADIGGGHVSVFDQHKADFTVSKCEYLRTAS